MIVVSAWPWVTVSSDGCLFMVGEGDSLTRRGGSYHIFIEAKRKRGTKDYKNRLKPVFRVTESGWPKLSTTDSRRFNLCLSQ